MEWVENEIDRGGTEAAEATLRSLLKCPVLPDSGRKWP